MLKSFHGKIKVKERGALLMAAIVLIVIIAAMVTAMSFLAVSNIGASGGHMISDQAYFIARSGLNRALFQFDNGTACTSLANTNLAVGTGSFTTSGTLYPTGATSATLNGALSNTATTIPVTNLANFAGHGSITIESETIYYSATSTQASVCGAAPCFYGATRGAAGSSPGAHANGVAVSQPSQCLVRSTGTVGNSNRILESSVQTVSPIAYLNGASTPVGTTATKIGSISTSLPTGDKLIIAVVTFNNTNATQTSIAAGQLQLQKGGTVLASNQFIVQAWGAPPVSSSSFSNESQYLLYKDASAAGNPTYDVYATASAAGLSAQVQMLVIHGVPNSSFESGGSVATALNCTQSTQPCGTTLLTHNSTVPAGNNLVLAAVALDNSSSSGRSNGFGTLLIQRTGRTSSSCPWGSMPVTCIWGNKETNTLTSSSNPNRGTGYLLIASDNGAPANPQYFVTGGTTASSNPLNAQVSMLVLNGVQYAQFANSNSLNISAAASLVTGGGGSTATTLPAGADAVIAHQQYVYTGSSTDTITAGNEQIRFNGATVASNPYDVNLCSSSTQCGDFTDALLYGVGSAAANPTYDLWTAESSTTNKTSTQITAFQVPSTMLQIDFQEIFP